MPHFHISPSNISWVFFMVASGFDMLSDKLKAKDKFFGYHMARAASQAVIIIAVMWGGYMSQQSGKLGAVGLTVVWLLILACVALIGHKMYKHVDEGLTLKYGKHDG